MTISTIGGSITLERGPMGWRARVAPVAPVEPQSAAFHVAKSMAEDSFHAQIVPHVLRCVLSQGATLSDQALNREI